VQLRLAGRRRALDGTWRRRQDATGTQCGEFVAAWVVSGQNERSWIPRTSDAGVTIALVLPGLDVAAVRHYCEQRVPPHALHQVRVELVTTRGAVTIVERLAPWREEIGPEWTSHGVARLRYRAKSGIWRLYWKDRNARWHRYDPIEPTFDIRVLLDEIDHDSTGIFWG
jgi:hypothetical protein